jgi:hypothetical protein
VVEGVVTLDRPGISNGGDPRRPTFSRTGPSTGIMTLVPSRTLSPVRPPTG